MVPMATSTVSRICLKLFFDYFRGWKVIYTGVSFWQRFYIWICKQVVGCAISTTCWVTQIEDAIPDVGQVVAAPITVDPGEEVDVCSLNHSPFSHMNRCSKTTPYHYWQRLCEVAKMSLGMLSNLFFQIQGQGRAAILTLAKTTYIHSLTCTWAYYTFIDCQTSYHSAPGSDFDDLYINILMRATGCDVWG